MRKALVRQALVSVADLGGGGGGGHGGQLPPPPFSSPPFSFLLVVCVVSVTVHTTPALHGARRSPPKYVAQKARASPVGDSLTPATISIRTRDVMTRRY